MCADTYHDKLMRACPNDPIKFMEII